MLDLDRIDLGNLCMALEDNSPEHGWWLDPRTGELPRMLRKAAARAIGVRSAQVRKPRGSEVLRPPWLEGSTTPAPGIRPLCGALRPRSGDGIEPSNRRAAPACRF
jgi:hypothetical protein